MGAYCTLVYTDNYIPGALVLGKTLESLDPEFKRIVLVTKDVSLAERKRLAEAWTEVRNVEPISAMSPDKLQLLGRAELGHAVTKLRIWDLPESRVVYLDADTLPLQSLSELFNIPLATEEVAASPDIGWPDIFNSGVLVANPNKETFSNLSKLAEVKGSSFDGSDQGLLNEYFENKWVRLPFLYNVTASVSYQYRPAFEKYKEGIKVFHFIGEVKPWNSEATDVMTTKWKDAAAKINSSLPIIPGPPVVDESKLIKPRPDHWDPAHFEPPLSAGPEAADFEERDSTEPPEFVFPEFGESVTSFPWESQTAKPERVFPSALGRPK